MATTALSRSWPNLKTIDPKIPIKRVVEAVFHVSGPDMQLFPLPAEKDIPRDELNGKSWREAMIWASEKVLKPEFGNDVLGQFGVRTINKMNKIDQQFIVDSVGFPDEAMCYIKQYHHTFILQIHREGKCFEKDSRRYLSASSFDLDEEWLNEHIAVINNQFDVTLYRAQLERQLTTWGFTQ